MIYTSTVKGQNIGERTNTKSGTCDHMDSGSSSSCDFSPCGAPDHKFVWLSDGRTAIYFITYIVWGILLRRHVVVRSVKRWLSAIVFLMLFWMIVRTVKFRIPAPDS